MPIWLRKFTFHQIQTHFDEEKQAYENQQNGNLTTAVDSSGKVHTPEFMKDLQPKTSPTYKTKASKK